MMLLPLAKRGAQPSSLPLLLLLLLLLLILATHLNPAASAPAGAQGQDVPHKGPLQGETSFWPAAPVSAGTEQNTTIHDLGDARRSYQVGLYVGENYYPLVFMEGDDVEERARSWCDEHGIDSVEHLEFVKDVIKQTILLQDLKDQLWQFEDRVNVPLGSFVQLDQDFTGEELFSLQATETLPPVSESQWHKGQDHSTQQRFGDRSLTPSGMLLDCMNQLIIRREHLVSTPYSIAETWCDVYKVRASEVSILALRLVKEAETWMMQRGLEKKRGEAQQLGRKTYVVDLYLGQRLVPLLLTEGEDAETRAREWCVENGVNLDKHMEFVSNLAKETMLLEDLKEQLSPYAYGVDVPMASLLQSEEETCEAAEGAGAEIFTVHISDAHPPVVILPEHLKSDPPSTPTIIAKTWCEAQRIKSSEVPLIALKIVKRAEAWMRERDPQPATDEATKAYVVDLYLGQDLRPLTIRQGEDVEAVAREWCVERNVNAFEHLEFVVDTIRQTMVIEDLKDQLSAYQYGVNMTMASLLQLDDELYEGEGEEIFSSQASDDENHQPVVVQRGHLMSDTPSTIAKAWCQANDVRAPEIPLVALRIVKQAEAWREEMMEAPAAAAPAIEVKTYQVDLNGDRPLVMSQGEDVEEAARRWSQQQGKEDDEKFVAHVSEVIRYTMRLRDAQDELAELQTTAIN